MLGTLAKVYFYESQPEAVAEVTIAYSVRV